MAFSVLCLYHMRRSNSSEFMKLRKTRAHLFLLSKPAEAVEQHHRSLLPPKHSVSVLLLLPCLWMLAVL